jgi:hypothetical protein
MALRAHSGPWPRIQFRNHFSQTVGILGRVISLSQGRYLNPGQHKHRINAHTNIYALCGIRTHDPTVRRTNTVHALDQWFSTFVRPRAGNFFSIRRGPSIIDARARYRAAVPRLRNTALERAATVTGARSKYTCKITCRRSVTVESAALLSRLRKFPSSNIDRGGGLLSWLKSSVIFFSPSGLMSEKYGKLDPEGFVP